MKFTPSEASGTLSVNANSIKGQIGWRLAILLIFAVFAAAYAVSTQIKHLDSIVQEVALGHQAQDIADALRPTPDGALELDLPPRLIRLYEQEHSGSIFVVRNARGDILFHDGDNALEVLTPGFTFPSDFELFQAVDMSPVEARGLDPKRYGLTERFSTPLGDVFISVAQHQITDDFLSHAIALELVDEAIIVGIPFVVVVLLAGFGLVRYSTRGLGELSRKAMDIGPQSLRARLPVHSAPAEVMPLAIAFNEVIDRVAEGYEAQQRFTIDAAHQLKTPLAILRTRLETLPHFQGRELLDDDLTHMEHLVRQLLTSARLSVIRIDPFSQMDLSALAAEIVERLAPMAIERGREIALEGAETPVMVQGEPHLATEAILNLAENALWHTPEGSVVTIRVVGSNKIEVADQGPGVPDSEKKHVFMPFGQGRRPTPNGTGMGLAIVSQIMALHDGAVTLEDNIGGGAVFTLSFRSMGDGPRSQSESNA